MWSCFSAIVCYLCSRELRKKLLCMKEIATVAELRSIQLALLDHITAYYDAQGIVYFLSCGSLIGALRHKGYIPWDDDIDLFMPRESYNRLLAAYRDPDPRYALLAPGRAQHYLYTYAKVIDRRTLVVEDEVPGYELGVYVDIFPLDYVTDCHWLRRHVVWKYKKHIYRMRRCKMQSNFLASRWHYLLYRYFPLPLRAIDAIIGHTLTGRKPTGTVCNMTEANVLERECFPAHCIEGERVEVEFEGKHYKTMPGYDEYLRHLYGDYMQLPPVEERVHHHFAAYWRDA